MCCNGGLSNEDGKQWHKETGAVEDTAKLHLLSGLDEVIGEVITAYNWACAGNLNTVTHSRWWCIRDIYPNVKMLILMQN